MEPIKINYCAAIAVITFVTGHASDANAKQSWNTGYSSTCSELGCGQHGNDFIELIPYGQSCGNDNAPTIIPYRGSFRAPVQSSFGDYSGGCGYGGSCSQSIQSNGNQYTYGQSGFDSPGGCPFEQRQIEQTNYDPRLPYGNQSPYYGGYEGIPNLDPRPYYTTPYSAPRQRILESYQQAPADRRPELQTSPSFEPGNSYGRNDLQPHSRPLAVPPTSTQIIPPPKLPPQPSESKSSQSTPKLLPLTNVPNNQPTTTVGMTIRGMITVVTIIRIRGRNVTKSPGFT